MPGKIESRRFKRAVDLYTEYLRSEEQALRLDLIDRSAAQRVATLKKEKGKGLADHKRWAAGQLHVCVIEYKTAPPQSLVALICMLLGAFSKARSSIRNPKKYRAAVEYVAAHPDATPSEIRRCIKYDQNAVIKHWLKYPGFQQEVEVKRQMAALRKQIKKKLREDRALLKGTKKTIATLGGK